MRVRALVAGSLLLCLPAMAAADVLPPKPDQRPLPPPPAGPSKAEVRGVEIGNEYGYWRGRRWLVRILRCPAEAATCVAGCIVDGIAGKEQRVQSVADVVAADKAAAGSPLELMLVACSSGRLVLPAPVAK